MNTKLNLQNIINNTYQYIYQHNLDPDIKYKIKSIYNVTTYSLNNNTSIRYSCFVNDVSKTSFYRWLTLFNQDISSLKNSSTKPHNLRVVYNWEILDPYINKLLNNTKRFYRINLPTIVWKLNKKFNLNMSVTTLYKHCSKRIYKVKKKKVTFNKRYEIAELGHIQMDGININNTSLTNKDRTKFHVFTAIDQYSRVAFAYCFDEKSKTNAIKFSNMAIKYYKSIGINVKHVRTDNGSEFVHTKTRWIKESQHRIVSSFEINLSRHFVTFDTTKPSTPQHNGKVERFNRSFRLDCINYLEKTKRNLSVEEINKRINKYLNFYNKEKYHNTLKKSPYEVLKNYLQYGEINEHTFA